MICHKCGKELNEDARFCGKCGQDQLIELISENVIKVHAEKQVQRKEDRNFGLQILFSGLIIFIIAFIGYHVFINVFNYGGKAVNNIAEKSKEMKEKREEERQIRIQQDQQRKIEREEERQNKIQQNEQRSTTTQSNTQQNQRSETIRQSLGNLQNTSNQTERLTYYVRGNTKTANVIFDHEQENRYFLDNAKNIVRNSRHRTSGSNWSNWQNDGIVQRHIPEFVNVNSVFGWLLAVMDFGSAIEQTANRERYILIFQNYGVDFLGQEKYYNIEGDYVHTLQRVYIWQ